MFYNNQTLLEHGFSCMYPAFAFSASCSVCHYQTIFPKTRVRKNFIPVLRRCPRSRVLLQTVDHIHLKDSEVFPCDKSSRSVRKPLGVCRKSTPLWTYHTQATGLLSCDVLQDYRVEYPGLFSTYSGKFHVVRHQRLVQFDWSASFLCQKAFQFSSIVFCPKPDIKNKAKMMILSWYLLH